jgi:hypothetical protein
MTILVEPLGMGAEPAGAFYRPLPSVLSSGALAALSGRV